MKILPQDYELCLGSMLQMLNNFIAKGPNHREASALWDGSSALNYKSCGATSNFTFMKTNWTSSLAMKKSLQSEQREFWMTFDMKMQVNSIYQTKVKKNH